MNIDIKKIEYKYNYKKTLAPPAIARISDTLPFAGARVRTPVESAVGSSPTLVAVARAVEAAAMEQAPGILHLFSFEMITIAF